MNHEDFPNPDGTVPREIPQPGFLEALVATVEVSLENLATFLTRTRWDALLAVIWLGFIFLGTAPLRQEEFTYAELLQARFLLAFSVLPIVIWALYVRAPRFELRLFRINMPRRHFPPTRRQWIRGGAAFVLLFGLLYLIDPLGLYALGHSKAIITILYTTDRQPLPLSVGAGFSNDPSASESVFYGRASVPIAWSRHDVNIHTAFPLNWKRNSILLETLQESEFFSLIRDMSQASSKHDAFVFVHGFRSPFAEAVGRVAKLAYDLRFQGASILYSWPAGNETSSYDHDHENADWSVKHLKVLLLRLASGLNVEQLHLVAHSMGSRVLGRALDAAQESGIAPQSFATVTFAAPDVDEPTFQQFSPAVTRAARRVTVYTSTWDLALAGSSGLHKGFRVGLVPKCRHAMDVIDTEGEDTSVANFNHSYLFDSQPVLYDLFLVTENYAPERRVGLLLAEDGLEWTPILRQPVKP